MSKTFRSVESFDEIRKECVGLIHERENTGIGCRTCVGFILSCGPILIGITKSLSDKLEDANYYILRTLLGFT